MDNIYLAELTLTRHFYQGSNPDISFCADEPERTCEWRIVVSRGRNEAIAKVDA
jgi:hypothetical protein